MSTVIVAQYRSTRQNMLDLGGKCWVFHFITLCRQRYRFGCSQQFRYQRTRRRSFDISPERGT